MSFTNTNIIPNQIKKAVKAFKKDKDSLNKLKEFIEACDSDSDSDDEKAKNIFKALNDTSSPKDKETGTQRGLIFLIQDAILSQYNNNEPDNPKSHDIQYFEGKDGNNKKAQISNTKPYLYFLAQLISESLEETESKSPKLTALHLKKFIDVSEGFTTLLGSFKHHPHSNTFNLAIHDCIDDFSRSVNKIKDQINSWKDRIDTKIKKLEKRQKGYSDKEKKEDSVNTPKIKGLKKITDSFDEQLAKMEENWYKSYNPVFDVTQTQEKNRKSSSKIIKEQKKETLKTLNTLLQKALKIDDSKGNEYNKPHNPIYDQIRADVKTFLSYIKTGLRNAIVGCAVAIPELAIKIMGLPEIEDSDTKKKGKSSRASKSEDSQESTSQDEKIQTEKSTNPHSYWEKFEPHKPRTKTYRMLEDIQGKIGNYGKK